MLVGCQLNLRVGHQVEDNNDAARCVGYNRLSWMQN